MYNFLNMQYEERSIGNILAESQDLISHFSLFSNLESPSFLQLFIRMLHHFFSERIKKTIVGWGYILLHPDECFRSKLWADACCYEQETWQRDLSHLSLLVPTAAEWSACTTDAITDINACYLLSSLNSWLVQNLG